MPPGREEYVAALKDTHLFRTLDDDQLSQVAAAMEYGVLSPGQDLFDQGDPAAYFYIIMSGKVSVHRWMEREERFLGTLSTGDYFGEEAFGKRAPRRPVSVTADEITGLLRMGKPAYERLLKEFPSIRPNMEIALSTHWLVQHNKLSWLNPDESIFLMARKHTYFLWEALTAPLAIGLTSLVMMALFYFAFLPGTLTPLLVTGAAYLLALGWGIWNYVDWSNDYNLVTDQRVVWMERVAGIYDSRQEAPLTTLLSVGIKTSQTGRWMGFGDVLVRTYTGTLTLHDVAYPQQVAALIEDQWTRTRRVDHEAELAVIENTLRARLDQADGAAPTLRLPAQPQATRPMDPEVRPGILQRLFANFFRLRFVEGNTITYRKHWFVLIRTTWLPVIGLLVCAGVALARVSGVFTSTDAVTTFAVCSVAGFVFLVWYFYEYEDWRNDIYQITADQIVDAEKKPLGQEERKVAPVENILSIEYRRLGLFGLLLNFGTVSIKVGTTKFDFEMVYNPSQVQQDIFRRMNERIEAKKQAEIAAERERISDWIMVYHRNTHSAREEQAVADAEQALYPPSEPLDTTDGWVELGPMGGEDDGLESLEDN
jgi:hypothetical protein